MKTIDNANKIIEAIGLFSEPLGSDLTPAHIKEAIAHHEAAVKHANITKAAAIQASNDKKAALKAIGDLITRVRSAARGKYGPDSTEYEQVGGTRASERKPKKKK
ncbi:MAG: hypothetical protein HUU55_00070 [Myxococcales bacterium]|nr:hypothetical protein [Myxococcales bacterium]